jgi:hypothetical protein
MAKKLLFVTTINLSMNPRILKEIKLAYSQNYKISFLGFYLGNWSDEMDEEIQKKIDSPKYMYLDATRKKYFQWLRYSLLERLNRIIWKMDKNNLFLAATASTKRTFSLLDFGKSVNPGDFDLVIGHTFGALYTASVIAKRAGCPYAFDMEDYHPGEHIDRNKEDEIKRRELIMKQILPGADYVSSSSHLIGQLTKNLCGLDKKKIISVLNFFPAEEFKPPVISNSRKIKLVWFSQFISVGRGLEILLSEWSKIKDDFELTLIGSADQTFSDNFQDGIKIIRPLPQIELHEQLGGYDIGLALDLTGRDLNRDIALTNKILAYYQAGLYILATDTAAQNEFIDQHPGAGKLFSQNDNASFLTAMRDIRGNIGQIRSGSIRRYQEAAKHSWEIESIKLRETWNQILN